MIGFWRRWGLPFDLSASAGFSNQMRLLVNPESRVRSGMLAGDDPTAVTFDDFLPLKGRRLHFSDWLAEPDEEKREHQFRCDLGELVVCRQGVVWRACR